MSIELIELIEIETKRIGKYRLKEIEVVTFEKCKFNRNDTCHWWEVWCYVGMTYVSGQAKYKKDAKDKFEIEFEKELQNSFRRKTLKKESEIKINRIGRHELKRMVHIAYAKNIGDIVGWWAYISFLDDYGPWGYGRTKEDALDDFVREFEKRCNLRDVRIRDLVVGLETRHW